MSMVGLLSMEDQHTASYTEYYSLDCFHPYQDVPLAIPSDMCSSVATFDYFHQVSSDALGGDCHRLFGQVVMYCSNSRHRLGALAV